MPRIYVQHIHEHRIPGKRLGRHIRQDSRSALYPYRARAGVVISAQLWARRIPILDQGDLGSCTGNALTGALGTDPDYADLPAGHPALDEAEAVKLYSAATKLDDYPGSYPPQDTGSDGISVCKAAQAAGLISGYTHCTDLPMMEAALMAGPVIVGVNWYDSFDRPDSTGYVEISADAFVRGGHEFLVRGIDPASQRFRADNSWGTSWGDGGSFQFSYATMTRLLAEQGDCTVPVPVAQPAPVPTPTPDQPTPADVAFAAVLNGTDRPGHPWIDEHHVAYNHRVQQAAIIWLQAKNLYGD
jgi:hypothetical protein